MLMKNDANMHDIYAECERLRAANETLTAQLIETQKELETYKEAHRFEAVELLETKKIVHAQNEMIEKNNQKLQSFLTKFKEQNKTN